MFHQAWVLIAHGDLNPFNTIKNSFPSGRTTASSWSGRMAALYWVWPHSVILLWLQDVSVVVAAEAVAFLWLCELRRPLAAGRGAAWLAAGRLCSSS